jgi:hypothetical protein
MRMQIGDLLACEHCPPDVVTETTEAGATLERTQPTCHPIIGFVPSRTIEQQTHVGMTADGAPVIEPQSTTFFDGRPILHCPTLHREQVHESARMRLVGTAERA